MNASERALARAPELFKIDAEAGFGTEKGEGIGHPDPQTWKDSPHPQRLVSLGLLKRNPSCRPSRV